MENTKCNKLFNLIKVAFEETMKEVTEEDVTIQDEEFKIQPRDEMFTSIVLCFVGKANGRIMVNTAVEDARKIAILMNFGKPLEYDDDLHIYLSEFAKVLGQKVLEKCDSEFQQHLIWISPPAIFSAKNLDIDTPNVLPKNLYYKSSLGDFIVDIGLSEITYDEF